jgi:signal transduction histidine kinase
MLNLLSNAIKYNRPDGWVELELRRAGDDGVQVIVEDAGVGIPPETLQQLFEPFQRGAQARGKIEGTGIGLSVTRGLVQAMAGRIEVHSTPDVGSSFIVTLPADLEPAPPAA